MTRAVRCNHCANLGLVLEKIQELAAIRVINTITIKSGANIALVLNRMKTVSISQKTGINLNCLLYSGLISTQLAYGQKKSQNPWTKNKMMNKAKIMPLQLNKMNQRAVVRLANKIRMVEAVDQRIIARASLVHDDIPPPPCRRSMILPSSIPPTKTTTPQRSFLKSR